MSKALKCDRCGVCFDPGEMTDGYFIRFYNPKKYEVGDVERGEFKPLLPNQNNNDYIVDLCPRCSVDFSLFMNGDCTVDDIDILSDQLGKEKDKNKELYKVNNSLLSDILKLQRENEKLNLVVDCLTMTRKE